MGLGFHDGQVGSALLGGYYGTVKKALRPASGHKVAEPCRTLRCGSGRRKDCYTAVQASLPEPVATLATRFGSDDPTTWNVDPTEEVIRLAPADLALASRTPWQNRPTFHQVVQIGESGS